VHNIAQGLKDRSEEDDMRIISGVCTALGLLAAPAIAADDAGGAKLGSYLSAPENPGQYTVNLNAGVGGYLGGLSDFTGVGPVWGVNVDGDVTRGIGWEVGYNGARTPITAPAIIPDGEAAWRHGLNAMAKLFAPGMETIRPFGGVGLGAAYINPSDGAETFYENDWVTEIPVALGVELGSNAGISAGLRATYRFQAGEEFAQRAVRLGENNPEGGLFSTALTFGGRF
jgi:hypothetical protein